MKIEFEVTAGMRRAISTNDNWPSLLSEEADALAAELFSHPDFKSQLRIYVAATAKRLVPAESKVGGPYHPHDFGHNACRATTLANIAAYEKEQEDGK